MSQGQSVSLYGIAHHQGGQAPCMSCGANLLAPQGIETQHCGSLSFECCSSCGFALDISWAPQERFEQAQGARAPLLIYCPAGGLALQLERAALDPEQSHRSSTPAGLLRHFIGSLQRRTPPRAIVLIGDERPLELAELAVSLRGLEAALGAAQQAAIWICCEREEHPEEHQLREGLTGIDWQQLTPDELVGCLEELQRSLVLEHEPPPPQP